MKYFSFVTIPFHRFEVVFCLTFSYVSLRFVKYPMNIYKWGGGGEECSINRPMTHFFSQVLLFYEIRT